MPPRPLFVANWKMNGLHADGLARASALAGHAAGGDCGGDIVVCPPATLLFALRAVFAGSQIELGGQDCHATPEGAHTGDVSAPMLADAGCAYVIVGHSERRAGHGEADETVAGKADGGPCGGARRHRLRRRERGRPRRRTGACSDRPPGRALAARRFDNRQHRDRLRAGLGHRHRPHAGPGRYRGGTRRSARWLGEAIFRERCGAPACYMAAPSRRGTRGRSWPRRVSTVCWSAVPVSLRTRSGRFARRAAESVRK